LATKLQLYRFKNGGGSFWPAQIDIDFDDQQICASSTTPKGHCGKRLLKYPEKRSRERNMNMCKTGLEGCGSARQELVAATSSVAYALLGETGRNRLRQACQVIQVLTELTVKM